MKKILGISLVAVLAVSPMMAGATDLTSAELAKGQTVTADASTLATTGYVKGAYYKLGTTLNTKQDQIMAGETEINTAVVQAGGISSSVDSASDTSLMSEKAVLKAIDDKNTAMNTRVTDLETTVNDATTGLVKKVADNTSAISTLNGDASTTGSVAKSIQDKVATLDANLSQTASTDGLALSITEVDGKITAISGSIAANTYASAAQGTKADNSVQAVKVNNQALGEDANGEVNITVATGTENGTIAVNGTDVSVAGLGTAAFTAATAYDAAGAADTAESNAKTYADGLVADKATKTGVLATINASTVPIMASWDAQSATTLTISAPNTFQTGSTGSGSL